MGMSEPTTTDAARRPAVERAHPPAAAMRLVNPVMKAILASPLHRIASRHLVVLHYSGRRTGKRYALPVGYRYIDGTLTLCTNAGWRVNFRGRRDLELTLAGERRAGHGILVEDPDIVAETYRRLIDSLGRQQAQRALGIRINVDRDPTINELTDGVLSSGLSLIRVTL
jgi:hypothetical protein